MSCSASNSSQKLKLNAAQFQLHALLMAECAKSKHSLTNIFPFRAPMTAYRKASVRIEMWARGSGREGRREWAQHEKKNLTSLDKNEQLKFAFMVSVESFWITENGWLFTIHFLHNHGHYASTIGIHFMLSKGQFMLYTVFLHRSHAAMPSQPKM